MPDENKLPLIYKQDYKEKLEYIKKYTRLIHPVGLTSCFAFSTEIDKDENLHFSYFDCVKNNDHGFKKLRLFRKNSSSRNTTFKQYIEIPELANFNDTHNLQNQLLFGFTAKVSNAIKCHLNIDSPRQRFDFDIEWQYLNHEDEWVGLTLRDDSTDNLNQTGDICFDLPIDITNESSFMEKGQYWIRVVLTNEANYPYKEGESTDKFPVLNAIYMYDDSLNWSDLFFNNNQSPQSLANLIENPDSRNGNLAPHQGLMLSFLQLLDIPGKLLNSQLIKHQLLYYQDFLRLYPLEVESNNQEVMVVSLDEGEDKYFLPANSIFDGGKTDDDEPIYYELTDSISLNHSLVTDVIYELYQNVAPSQAAYKIVNAYNQTVLHYESRDECFNNDVHLMNINKNTQGEYVYTNDLYIEIPDFISPEEQQRFLEIKEIVVYFKDVPVFSDGLDFLDEIEVYITKNNHWVPLNISARQNTGSGDDWIKLNYLALTEGDLFIPEVPDELDGLSTNLPLLKITANRNVTILTDAPTKIDFKYALYKDHVVADRNNTLSDEDYIEIKTITLEKKDLTIFWPYLNRFYVTEKFKNHEESTVSFLYIGIKHCQPGDIINLYIDVIGRHTKTIDWQYQNINGEWKSINQYVIDKTNNLTTAGSVSLTLPEDIYLPNSSIKPNDVYFVRAKVYPLLNENEYIIFKNIFSNAGKVIIKNKNNYDSHAITNQIINTENSKNIWLPYGNQYNSTIETTQRYLNRLKKNFENKIKYDQSTSLLRYLQQHTDNLIDIIFADNNIAIPIFNAFESRGLDLKKPKYKEIILHQLNNTAAEYLSLWGQVQFQNPQYEDVQLNVSCDVNDISDDRAEKQIRQALISYFMPWVIEDGVARDNYIISVQQVIDVLSGIEFINKIGEITIKDSKEPWIPPNNATLPNIIDNIHIGGFSLLNANKVDDNAFELIHAYMFSTRIEDSWSYKNHDNKLEYLYDTGWGSDFSSNYYIRYIQSSFVDQLANDSLRLFHHNDNSEISIQSVYCIFPDDDDIDYPSDAVSKFTITYNVESTPWVRQSDNGLMMYNAFHYHFFSIYFRDSSSQDPDHSANTDPLQYGFDGQVQDHQYYYMVAANPMWGDWTSSAQVEFDTVFSEGGLLQTITNDDFCLWSANAAADEEINRFQDKMQFFFNDNQLNNTSGRAVILRPLDFVNDDFVNTNLTVAPLPIAVGSNTSQEFGLECDFQGNNKGLYKIRSDTIDKFNNHLDQYFQRDQLLFGVNYMGNWSDSEKEGFELHFTFKEDNVEFKDQIKWQYLDNEEKWIELDIIDHTDGFKSSGKVSISLPLDFNKDSVILPNNLFWFRAVLVLENDSDYPPSIDSEVLTYPELESLELKEKEKADVDVNLNDYLIYQNDIKYLISSQHWLDYVNRVDIQEDIADKLKFIKDYAQLIPFNSDYYWDSFWINDKLDLSDLVNLYNNNIPADGQLSVHHSLLFSFLKQLEKLNKLLMTILKRHQLLFYYDYLETVPKNAQATQIPVFFNVTSSTSTANVLKEGSKLYAHAIENNVVEYQSTNDIFLSSATIKAVWADLNCPDANGNYALYSRYYIDNEEQIIFHNSLIPESLPEWHHNTNADKFSSCYYSIFPFGLRFRESDSSVDEQQYRLRLNFTEIDHVLLDEIQPYTIQVLISGRDQSGTDIKWIEVEESIPLIYNNENNFFYCDISQDLYYIARPPEGLDGIYYDSPIIKVAFCGTDVSDGGSSAVGSVLHFIANRLSYTEHFNSDNHFVYQSSKPIYNQYPNITLTGNNFKGIVDNLSNIRDSFLYVDIKNVTKNEMLTLYWTVYKIASSYQCEYLGYDEGGYYVWKQLINYIVYDDTNKLSNSGNWHLQIPEDIVYDVFNDKQYHLFIRLRFGSLDLSALDNQLNIISVGLNGVEVSLSSDLSLSSSNSSIGSVFLEPESFSELKEPVEGVTNIRQPLASSLQLGHSLPEFESYIKQKIKLRSRLLRFAELREGILETFTLVFDVVNNSNNSELVLIPDKSVHQYTTQIETPILPVGILNDITAYLQTGGSTFSELVCVNPIYKDIVITYVLRLKENSIKQVVFSDIEKILVNYYMPWFKQEVTADEIKYPKVVKNTDIERLILAHPNVNAVDDIILYSGDDQGHEVPLQEMVLENNELARLFVSPEVTELKSHYRLTLQEVAS